MKDINLRFLVPLILSANLYAQTGVLQKPPIQQSTPPVASLTELEQTKLELYSTQNLVLRQQEQELRAKFDKLIAGINISHPGYQFNQQTGQLQPVPAQPQVKPEEKKPEVKK